MPESEARALHTRVRLGRPIDGHCLAVLMDCDAPLTITLAAGYGHDAVC